MTRLAIAIIALAVPCMGQPKILTSNPAPKGTTYSDAEAGTLYVTLCTSEKGMQFAPIQYWRSNEGHEVIELDDLSSLDEMVRRELNVGGTARPNKEVIQDAVMMLGAYVNNRTDNLLLLDPVRNRYLAELGKHVSEAEYKRIEPSFMPIGPKIDEAKWELGFLVRTKRGALERRIFFGTFTPFVIKRSQVEILQPNGTLPNFPFAP